MRILIFLILSQLIFFQIKAQPTCSERLESSELVNQNRYSSLDGYAAWEYHRTYSNSDLNGDGKTERIHLLANVELINGKPAWDDGQLWELIVEEKNGTKTSVFLDYIQLGSVEVNLIKKVQQSQELLLIIRQGADITIITINYKNPDKFSGCKVFSGVVDSYSKNWNQQ